MYLEISGRRSGKTTKLVNAVVVACVEGKECVVVAMNMCMAKNLERQVENILPYNNIKFTCPHALNSIGAKPTPKAVYWFYDEFDFIKGDIVISDNGYYATTPSKIRTSTDIINHVMGVVNDPLIELIIKNKGYYARTTWERYDA